ncbi:hypothetical protein [uncultured Aquimarina sp.]|uniref:hypothetical protein n=1 Tax=uncultured Aquimarina sp. TaxID=575652 RepID=UPI002617BB44|nr:hypothetical protein [uncultured Aquimarina sp.]
MKKLVYILLIILLIGIIAGVKLNNKITHIATYQSPDGNYELIIKNDRSIFFSTTPGDGGMGSMPVEVILKNADGKTIGKSSDNSDCSIFNDSVEIVWDLENDQVWYGKSKTIHLKTGKVEC